MKKIMGLGAMLLAGLLVIPGNLWLASQVLAQSDSKTIEDKQRKIILPLLRDGRHDFDSLPTQVPDFPPSLPQPFYQIDEKLTWLPAIISSREILSQQTFNDFLYKL